MKKIPIIDTHQHLWDLDQLSLPWLKEAPLLNKNHRINDYLLAIKDCNIESSIYMEVDVSLNFRTKEREVISNLCARDEIITKAAVFGATPGHPDFKKTLEALSKNKYAKGARLVLQSPEKERGICLNKDFVTDVQSLGDHNLLFDICIRPAELTDAAELASKCPKTTFVLDHCGNADPNIVSGKTDISVTSTYQHNRETWFNNIKQISDYQNVICKISGIVARAKPNWNPDDLAPTVNHCINCFGEDRVIFGSDWPVCTTTAALLEWTNALRTIVSSRSDQFQRKFFHENAKRIYSIE